jgi:cytochrome P450
MQERLLQELIDNDITEDTELTADLTDRLVFQDKYIKEMQRRHNPSFQPGRTAKGDLILPGGYRLPKASAVIAALHHIHNNPKLWDNPAQFDPDRWDTPEVILVDEALHVAGDNVFACVTLLLPESHHVPNRNGLTVPSGASEC